MAKEEEKTEKIEREYVINLRRKVDFVPIYKRTPKAVKTIKEYLAKHMKVYDRDLRKIKLDRYLNEFLWARGIRNPRTRIKVKAVKEGGIVRAELSELPSTLKFKKAKEERRELKGAEAGKAKKEEKKEKQEEIKTEEKKEEEKEKKAATIEAGKEMEKAAKKMAKHDKKARVKEPKHEHRMALQK